MDRLYREALEAADSGMRVPAGGLSGIIPGLYGLKLGGWVPWHPDRAVRIARVNTFFGR